MSSHPVVPADTPTDTPEVPCCDNCGRHVDQQPLEEFDGELWCEDCFNDDTVVCCHCDDRVHTDVANYHNDNWYCDSCFGEIFARCESCEECFELDNMHASSNGELYCDDCYSEAYTACEHCGCELRRDGDYTYYDDLGDAYCADCFPREESDDECMEWNSATDIVGHRFAKIGSHRKYGVELELHECKGYSEIEGITPFGAVDDGTVGVMKEFVSPVLQGDEGLEAIEAFCQVANQRNWQVNESCGYHIHIDCGHLSESQCKAVAIAYAATYEVWASFVPASRRENKFCRRHTWSLDEIKNSDWDDLVHDTTRYIWVNWLAYYKHETVEVRLHTGTIDADKVCNWVKAHTRFVDWAARKEISEIEEIVSNARDGGIETLFMLLSRIWNDVELSEFYRQRAAKFGTQYSPIVTNQAYQAEFNFAS